MGTADSVMADSAKGCLWGGLAIGAVVLAVVLADFIAGSDASSRPACRHFHNVAAEAHEMTDAELRRRLEEIHEDATSADPAVAAAARQMRSTMDDGDLAGFEAAIKDMATACAEVDP